MFSQRRTVFTLLLISLLLLTVGHASRAQEASEVNPQFESDEEMLSKVEKDVQLLVAKKVIRNADVMTLKAEQQLKKILELYPKTFLRERVEENLFQVRELLATHNLQIARFYSNRYLEGSGGIKGAESRLLHINREYPNFSRMDEVLLLLGKIYLKSEQPEDAANYFWKLVCKYPGSEYRGEAFEQLSKMGINTSEDCNSLKLK